MAVPADPEKVGVLWLVSVPLAGDVRVTTGVLVFTVHVASAGVGSTWNRR